MRYRGSRYKYSRIKDKPKAVAFIWFALMTLPILLFFCALTIDAGRIYMTNRQAANLVESAALAGMQSDVVEIGEIEGNLAYGVESRYEAEERINRMINIGLSSGAVTGVKESSTTEIIWGLYSNSVEVRLNYEMKGLVFDRLWGFQDLSYSASAIGFVCTPGDSSTPTDGFCARTLQ